MAHTFGWIDRGCASVDYCGDTLIRIPSTGKWALTKETPVIISTKRWEKCPVCGKLLKLKQINEILEKDGNGNSN